MGRGLSKLQRYIVSEAARRERLYYADILVGYFRWQPNPSHSAFDASGNITRPGTPSFSRWQVGAKLYAKTMVTLGRACRLLGDRGLVTCLQGAHWSALEITDHGKACVKKAKQAAEDKR